MLPAIRPQGWPHHIDVMLRLGGDQEVRIHRATIESGRARKQITLGEGLLDRGPHDPIWGRGRRGDHLRHEIRRARITGLREVELLTHPMGVAFPAVARLHGIRRRDAPRRGRLFLCRAPAAAFQSWHRTAGILLEPDLPQGLQGGEIAEG
jgi:hypothetical protein